MSLDQVFIFSKSYRARKMEENLQEDPSLSQLGWQERIVLHYRLLPSPQDDRGCNMSMFETNSLQTRENHEGMHAFACMEHAHERFNVRTYFSSNSLLYSPIYFIIFESFPRYAHSSCPIICCIFNVVECCDISKTTGPASSAKTIRNSGHCANKER